MGFLDPYRVSVSVSPISETIKRLNSRLTERFRANLRTRMAHFFQSQHQQLPNVAYQALFAVNARLAAHRKRTLVYLQTSAAPLSLKAVTSLQRL